VNKLENVSSGQGGKLKFNDPKIEDEGETLNTNYEEERKKPAEQQERQTDDRESGSPDELMARERNRRQREKREKPASEGWGPDPRELAIMNSYTVPVTDIFKRAFNISTSKGV
jgi:hypothetical protein